MFSPEQNFGTPKRQEPEEFPHLTKALDMAERRVFANAIKEEDFIKETAQGPYSAKDVEEDLKYLKTREQRFVEDSWGKDFEGNRSRIEALEKVAHAFEGVMLESDLLGWLGEGVDIIIPSRYDDVVNGVDGIAEFHNGGFFSHLALGLDVTSSERVSGKFERITDDIKKGELTLIRYFESERMHFKGEKRNIPRVVVGADRQTVYDLTRLWAEKKTHELEDHHMQIQMLSEVHHQLQAFALYARKHGKEGHKETLGKIYDTTRGTVNGIIKGHVERRGEAKVRAMLFEAEKDNVYRSMMEKLARDFGYTPGDLLNK